REPGSRVSEVEERDVARAVIELDRQEAARSNPARGGFPGVRVDLLLRVVGERAAARRIGRDARVERNRLVAVHLLRVRRASGEDVQSRVPTEAEFDRNARARVGTVEGRRILD